MAKFPTARAELEYLVTLLLPGSTSAAVTTGIQSALRDAFGTRGIEAFDANGLYLATDDFRSFTAGADATARFVVLLDGFWSFREVELWKGAIGRTGTTLTGLEAYDAPGFLPFDVDHVAVLMLHMAAGKIMSSP